MKTLEKIGVVMMVFGMASADSPDIRYPMAIFAIGSVLVLVATYFVQEDIDD